MKRITVAICAYNARDRLAELVPVLAAQTLDGPWEILVVDNNSTDGTDELIREMSRNGPVPIKVVRETAQGIPYARNRAIDEAADSAYLAFIDTDEAPLPGWLEAAVDALDREGAECAGGPIRVRFPGPRPAWLRDELLKYLGSVDHGGEPFWIRDYRTPVWSGNIAYRLSLFRSGLRFDPRYNRAGRGVGGGSDAVMFRLLVDQRARMRYRPDMVIEHWVGCEKMNRRYFLHLNLLAGIKFGRFEQEKFDRALFGVPLFLVKQAALEVASTLGKTATRRPDAMLAAVSTARTIGALGGSFQRWRRGE